MKFFPSQLMKFYFFLLIKKKFTDEVFSSPADEVRPSCVGQSSLRQADEGHFLWPFRGRGGQVGNIS